MELPLGSIADALYGAPLAYRLYGVPGETAATTIAPESSSSGSKYYVRLVIRTLVINIGHEYFRIDSLNFHKITSKINRPRPD